MGFFSNDNKHKCKKCGNVWFTPKDREKELRKNLKGKGLEHLGSILTLRFNTANTIEINSNAMKSELTSFHRCPRCGKTN